MSLITIDIDATSAQADLEAVRMRTQAALNAAMAEIKKGALDDYGKTVRTWRHKPQFDALDEVRGDGATLVVGTDDRVYRFVSGGTAAHYIFPRKPGGVLAFKWGGPGSYRAKTRPGVIASSGGRLTGGVPRVFRGVLHPGTEARNFGETIRRKWAQRVTAIFDRHLKRALKGR